MFAYEPADGFKDDRDAVEWPWELWEQEVQALGGGVADLFAEETAADPPDDPRGAG
ncbi:MAG: hypothetical protein ACR2ML_10560 [Solirubrobacteraceae bacterium]